MQREILVYKTKHAMIMTAIGTASSLGITLFFELVIKHH